MAPSYGLASSKWALPTFEEFLSTRVQRLSPSTVPEDDSCCHICQQEYTSTPENEDETDKTTLNTLALLDELPHAQLKNTGTDEPLRLPCTHILGSSCLQSWFASSHTNTCPLCKTRLFALPSSAEPSQEYGRRFHTIKNLPLRPLLTSTWTTHQTVFLAEDVTPLLGRLPRLLFKVASTTQRPRLRGPLAFPGQRFAMDKDDATNFRHFVLEYEDQLPSSQTEKQPYMALLRSAEAGEAYASICGGLRALAGREMPVLELYAALLGYAGSVTSEELARIVVLTIRALVDYEQRMSDLDTICGEWEMGV